MDFSWYAVQTRSRQEKVASKFMAARGLEVYLPVYRVRHRWSDRVKVVELPLFRGYLFCRFDPQEMVPVLSAPGVVKVVGFGREPAPVPEEEIRAVRRMVTNGLVASPCPYLREGMKVRIRSGPLAGLEGQLRKIKSRYCLVVSVHLLQRSVAAEVNPEDVEAV
jgi:transcription antitermination factor NusG